MTGPAPTLYDVAREAGVSLATASRVVNGSSRQVAESYRVRVQEAAHRLGYTANLSAQAIARGSAAIVALLVSDIADPYFGQLAAGVARGADERGLVVTIATTDSDPSREARLVRALGAYRPRGLVLAASRTGGSVGAQVRAELDAVAAAGGRVVALGPGVDGARSVVVDNHGGAAALGTALAARGYRDAVVLAAQEGVRTSDERAAGFAAGFGAAGGTVHRVRHGGFTREQGRELAERELAAGLPAGTLLVAVADVIALGALAALRAGGRAVGTDVALCGFDDVPAARDVTPGLTTVRVPLEDVGYEAVRAVAEDDWRPGRATLPLEVVLRDSTPGRP